MDSFVNKYDLSSKNLREFQWIYMMHHKWIYVAGLAMACLMAMGIYGVATYRGGSIINSLILIAFAPFVAAIVYFKIHKDAIMKSAACARHNGDNMSTRSINFADDAFTVTDDHVKSPVVCEYTTIRKVKETREVFILQLSSNMMLMLKKDSFVVGDAAKFSEFVWQRRLAAGARR